MFQKYSRPELAVGKADICGFRQEKWVFYDDAAFVGSGETPCHLHTYYLRLYAITVERSANTGDGLSCHAWQWRDVMEINGLVLHSDA